MIKVVFMGQGRLAEKCFDIILGCSEFNIVAACSNNNQDIWWKSCNIKNNCETFKIDFISNETKACHDKIMSIIKNKKVDVILSVRHRFILSREMLEMVDYHAYNLHCAKLPDYKGYNACNHAILNGDKEYFVTIHKMVEEVDAGEILLSQLFGISDNDTAQSIYHRADVLGLQLYGMFLSMLYGGVNIKGKPIDGDGKFYPRNSLDGLRKINDIKDKVEVDMKSRAFYFPPFEPAYYEIGGKKYNVTPSVIK